MPSPPNILWICTDQQRFETLRSFGNPHAQTPHLDRLVAEGTSFSNAFCQSPVCAPSRASFLTGRYPRTTRCRQNGQSIPPDELLVSTMFKRAKYRCGLAGKLHLASCSDGKLEKRTDDGYNDFSWSHHPQPDWEENAYTQWLKDHGQDWAELQGEEISPFIKQGPPAEFHQTTWCAEKTIEFIREKRVFRGFSVSIALIRTIPSIHPLITSPVFGLRICLCHPLIRTRKGLRPAFRKKIESGHTIIRENFTPRR
mgnify:CR=1 FL=1